MLEVLLDSLKDTAILIPFLLAVHLLIGLFEARKLNSLKKSRLLGGGFAPLLGVGVALLPQCGFSVVASELYSKKYIKVGTLMAVFVATSDEALPILLGHSVTDASALVKLALLVGIKVVMALLLGYALELFSKRKPQAEAVTAETSQEHHAHGCCGHHVGEEDDKQNIFSKYFKHPIIHTLVTTGFIFVVNFALGTVIHLTGGEENFALFMSQGTWLQPLFATIIGLIPNCASSVMITEMYASGALTLGATVSGLAVNAGIGVAVLFKQNKNLKANLAILCGLVVYALVFGYGITAIESILLL